MKEIDKDKLLEEEIALLNREQGLFEDESVPHMDIAGMAIDGFSECSDEELKEMLAFGAIYHPYVPLQVSRLGTQTLTADDIRKMTPEERMKLAETMASPNKRCAPPWRTPDGYEFGGGAE
jgi:hypothetical protein